MRRSSRSVCVNIGEGYRKKKYPAHFISKISDSDSENTETNVWLDFSKDCKYITQEQHLKFISRNEEIGKLLNHMMNNPDKY
jgi:four helix bundle protein